MSYNPMVRYPHAFRRPWIRICACAKSLTQDAIQDHHEVKKLPGLNALRSHTHAVRLSRTSIHWSRTSTSLWREHGAATSLSPSRVLADRAPQPVPVHSPAVQWRWCISCIRCDCAHAPAARRRNRLVCSVEGWYTL